MHALNASASHGGEARTIMMAMEGASDENPSTLSKSEFKTPL